MNPWEKWGKEIIKEYLESPNKFLRKKQISRTMHPAGNYQAYWNVVRNRKDLIRAAKDSKIGEPRLWKETECSFVSLQNILYRTIMEDNGLIEFDSITEIGGGYGNNARFQRNLKFDGPINLLDIFPVSRIQKEFCERNELENITFDSVSENTIKPTTENALLYSTFALSEMPFDQREIVKSFVHLYKYVFIAYKLSEFNEVNNVEYFKQFSDHMTSNGFETKFLKSVGPQTQYLIGVKSDNPK